MRVLTREELPWLYYPENDSVRIINAHNFPGGGGGAPVGIGGEVGWWCPSLDTDGNGTTTLNDLSGNANHGTLTNMDAATDWVADTTSGGVRALDFAFATPTEYVSIPANSNTGRTKPLSVFAWIKISGLPLTSSNHVFGAYNESSASQGYALAILGSTGAVRVWDGASWKAGTINVNDGAWHHIGATFDGTNVRIYVDGVLDSTTASTGPSTAFTSDTVAIAARRDGNGQILGLIDDLRVFDSALDLATEISLLASQRGYQP